MPGSSEITPAVVSHMAHLARIALTDEEVAKLTGELGLIVESVAKVTAVATPDVPATSHPIPLGMVTRMDVVGQTLTAEQALSGAPATQDGQFKVSSILGEEQ
ncbi:MAG: Asp-tRNA(Asn)/Glu-tRNA(Gln) amidotransferase subunit GatC [Pseudolysinimonas sp.]|uniref:Asp-tRNA(Asn)/Glu-tRNA(Gln) amidotransferase subunit GatC n=1 Tax=Pseudolysinimonas sp. TaxID=2680009 RepID=UPI003267EBAB